MRPKDLLRRLAKLGAEIVQGRGKGSHVLVRYGDRQATVPVHGGGRELGPVFIKKLARQLGIDPEELH